MRGEQVSGEYLGARQPLGADGWFPTRDGGSLDDEGYLFLEGRIDDVIVRGGENISPGEIEDVLLEHPARRRLRGGRRARRAVGRGRRGRDRAASAGAAAERRRAARVGEGAPALVARARARRVRAPSCPTTRPASCCAARSARRSGASRVAVVGSHSPTRAGLRSSEVPPRPVVARRLQREPDQPTRQSCRRGLGGDLEVGAQFQGGHQVRHFQPIEPSCEKLFADLPYVAPGDLHRRSPGNIDRRRSADGESPSKRRHVLGNRLPQCPDLVFRLEAR